MSGGPENNFFIIKGFRPEKQSQFKRYLIDNRAGGDTTRIPL